MADATANLNLPYLLPSQAQKHVTLNESLSKLDALVQLAVESRSLAAEPSAPLDGARYILPSAAAGLNWAGKAAGCVAHFHDGAWTFTAPRGGFVAFARDEARLLYFDGAVWAVLQTTPTELHALTAFGLNAVGDAATPFFAKLGKALFSAKPVAEGGDGDLRCVLNKEGAGGIASLLLQSGFSGRAEIGLLADDDLRLKVSSDGAAWIESLKIARNTGIVRFAQGASAAALNNGPLAGFRNRLINADFQINQRGFAGGALAANLYGHDRWRAGAGGATYSVTGRVVTLATGSLMQICEAPGLAGADVTVSVDGISAIPIGVTLSASGGGSGAVSGTIAAGAGRRGVTLAVPSGATANLALELSGAGAVFQDIQLEPGFEATPFEFRPASVQRSLCERYFEVLPGSGGAAAGYAQAAVRYGAASIDALVAFRAVKRASPSLYSSAPAFVAGDPGAGNQVAAFNYAAGAYIAASGAITLMIGSSRPTGALFRIGAATSFSGAAGSYSEIGIGAGAVLGFDAEL